MGTAGAAGATGADTGGIGAAACMGAIGAAGAGCCGAAAAVGGFRGSLGLVGAADGGWVDGNFLNPLRGKRQALWATISSEGGQHGNFLNPLRGKMLGGVTFVTALYDIGRENDGDGRKFSDYLAWFALPMVIFGVKSTCRFAGEKRAQLKDKTHLVTQDLADIPCYKHLPAVKKLLDQGYGKLTDLVYKLPLYSIVIYSKFGWLKEAIRINPFKSQTFIWIDAGLSRFFPSSVLIKQLALDQKWVERIGASKRVWFQGGNRLHKAVKKNKLYNPDELIGKGRPLLAAGVFGGEIKSLTRMCSDVLLFFQDDMIGKHRFGTEETAMFILFQKHPERFQAIVNRPKTTWQRITGTYIQAGHLLQLLMRNPKQRNPKQLKLRFHPEIKTSL